MEGIVTKKCSKCTNIKELFEFPKDKRRKDGVGAQCRKCKSSAGYLWRVQYKRKIKYSFDEYEKTLLAQDGKCAICGRKERLCVDHNHANGKVRGLLCSSCNKGLGFFKDNPQFLASAIQYLIN